MDDFYAFLKPISNTKLFDLLKEVEEQFEFCYQKQQKAAPIYLLRASAGLPSNLSRSYGQRGAPGNGMQGQLMNAHRQLLEEIMEIDRQGVAGENNNENELDAIEMRIRAIQEQLNIFRRRDDDIVQVDNMHGVYAGAQSELAVAQANNQVGFRDMQAFLDLDNQQPARPVQLLPNLEDQELNFPDLMQNPLLQQNRPLPGQAEQPPVQANVDLDLNEGLNIVDAFEEEARPALVEQAQAIVEEEQKAVDLNNLDQPMMLEELKEEPVNEQQQQQPSVDEFEVGEQMCEEQDLSVVRRLQMPSQNVLQASQGVVHNNNMNASNNNANNAQQIIAEASDENMQQEIPDEQALINIPPEIQPQQLLPQLNQMNLNQNENQIVIAMPEEENEQQQPALIQIIPEQLPVQEVELPQIAVVPSEQLPVLEEVIEPVAVVEPVVQEAPVEAVAMSFGIPDSVWLENDIDPAILHDLPEDTRADIIAGIGWVAPQQPVQPLLVLEDQALPQQQPEQPQVQNELQELGLDEEFLNNLPEDMRQEIIENARQERRRAVEAQNPANQPVAQEMEIGDVIAAVHDPAIRTEMLLSLEEAQVVLLPPDLRAELNTARDRLHQQRHRQRQDFERIFNQARVDRGAQHNGAAGAGGPGMPRLHREDEVLRRMMLGMRPMGEEAAADQLNVLNNGQMWNDPKTMLSPAQAHALFYEKIAVETYRQDKSKQIEATIIQLENLMSQDDELISLLLSDVIQVCNHEELEEGDTKKQPLQHLNNVVPLLQILISHQSAVGQGNKAKVANAINLILRQCLSAEHHKSDDDKQQKEAESDAMQIDTMVQANQTTKETINWCEHAFSKMIKPSRKVHTALVMMGLTRALSQGSRTFSMHLLKGYLFQDYSYKWSKTIFGQSAKPPSSQSVGEEPNNLLATIVNSLTLIEEANNSTEKQSSTTLKRNSVSVVNDLFKDHSLSKAFESVQSINQSSQSKNKTNQKTLSIEAQSVRNVLKVVLLPAPTQALQIRDSQQLTQNIAQSMMQLFANNQNQMQVWTTMHAECQQVARQQIADVNLILKEVIDSYKALTNAARLQKNMQSKQKSSGDVEMSSPNNQNQELLVAVEPINSLLERQASMQETEPVVDIAELAIMRQKSQYSQDSKQQTVGIGSLYQITKDDERTLAQTLKQQEQPLFKVQQTLSLYQYWLNKTQAYLKANQNENKEASKEQKAAMQAQKQIIDQIQDFFQCEELRDQLDLLSQVFLVCESSSSASDTLSQTANQQVSDFSKAIRGNLVTLMQTYLPELKTLRGSNSSNQANVPERIGEPNQQAAANSSSISMSPLTKEGSKHISKIYSIFRIAPTVGTAAVEIENKEEIGTEQPVQQTSSTTVALPPRLIKFGQFCLANKKVINQMMQSALKSQQQQHRHRGEPQPVQDPIEQAQAVVLSEMFHCIPGVLDFENKRQFFRKEIDKLRREAGAGTMHIDIKRDKIFTEAYAQLNHKSVRQLKGSLAVNFIGEPGQDVGGVTRDFMIELSKAMFNPNYSLFNLTSNGVSFYPNPQSYVNPDHLNFFKFIGRVIGKAVFDGNLLECFFSRPLYKCMVGEQLQFGDLEDMDHDFSRNCRWGLQNDVECLDLHYVASQSFFGRHTQVDLVPEGSNKEVTNDNKYDYFEKIAFFKMYQEVQQQMDAFLKGFYELIPKEIISIFSYSELELLISGLPNFDLEDLKKHTDYNGYTKDSKQCIWLQEALAGFDKEELASFLQFVTGSSKIPLEGFRALQGMRGPQNFTIARIRGDDVQRLPQGHTCFNTLDLPEYPTKELLTERLLFAIRETKGFGFA